MTNKELMVLLLQQPEDATIYLEVILDCEWYSVKAEGVLYNSLEKSVAILNT